MPRFKSIIVSHPLWFWLDWCLLLLVFRRYLLLVLHKRILFQKVCTFESFLRQWLVFSLYRVNGLLLSPLELTFSFGFPINVLNQVFSTSWPCVFHVSMLFPFFPVTDKSFAIRVVKNSLSVAFIVFEVSNVSLTIGPHVSTLTVFPSINEIAEKKSAIRPLEKTFTVHSVLNKRSLVYFTTGSDPAAPSINLTFVELTLKNRVIWENLKTHPVWFSAFKIYLTAILGSTFSIIPV